MSTATPTPAADQADILATMDLRFAIYDSRLAGPTGRSPPGQHQEIVLITLLFNCGFWVQQSRRRRGWHHEQTL